MMNFRKKLKIRLWTAISYIVIGVAAIVIAAVTETDNAAVSSFGAAFLVMGIARLRQYARITKNEFAIRQQEIRETDERNVYIIYKAKNAAFNVFLMLLCVAVIVLEIMQHELAVVLAMIVGALLVIYWVTYWIIRKRS